MSDWIKIVLTVAAVFAAMLLIGPVVYLMLDIWAKHYIPFVMGFMP